MAALRRLLHRGFSTFLRHAAGHVHEKEAGPQQTRLQYLVVQLAAGGPGERTPAVGVLSARVLAHQDAERSRRSFAHHRLIGLPVLGEWALTAPALLEQLYFVNLGWWPSTLIVHVNFAVHFF